MTLFFGMNLRGRIIVRFDHQEKIMIRIILVVTALFTAVLGWSQKKISFGLAGVAGASTLIIDQAGLGRSNATTELRPTFGGELMLNVILSDHFEFETKAGFLQCGTYNQQGGIYQDAKFGYVSVKPFNLKGYVGYPNHFGFAVGPHIGLLLFGEREYNYIDPVTNEKIVASRDFSVGDAINNDYKQLNLGIRFGPYVELKNGLYASLDYVLGVTDIRPESASFTPEKLNTFSLSIGFMLSNLLGEEK